MINEEIANKAITIVINLAKPRARDLIELSAKLLGVTKDLGKEGIKQSYKKIKGHKVKLSKLVEKAQLSSMKLDETDLKDVKRDLNRYGVKFSVMKDKENDSYVVFFQAKDISVIENAVGKIKEKMDKVENRESTIKRLEKAKDKSKIINQDKDKLKNKHKEQSL